MSNHRQSGYSPKIYADDRWIRWDSKKWPLERERRAHQPQPLELPQRPLSPVLYLGQHQETCARGITRPALLAELLQAEAALPQENPKVATAAAAASATCSPRATAHKEQATAQALRWAVRMMGTANVWRTWLCSTLGSSGILCGGSHPTKRDCRWRWSADNRSMRPLASPRPKRQGAATPLRAPCPPP